MILLNYSVGILALNENLTSNKLSPVSSLFLLRFVSVLLFLGFSLFVCLFVCFLGVVCLLVLHNKSFAPLSGASSPPSMKRQLLSLP